MDTNDSIAYFEQQLQMFSEEANARCGLVYELFVELFSEMVDTALKALDPSLRDQAIELAEQHGYVDAEIRQKDRASAYEDGLCRHFLPHDCCPAGCGDL